MSRPSALCTTASKTPRHRHSHFAPRSFTLCAATIRTLRRAKRNLARLWMDYFVCNMWLIMTLQISIQGVHLKVTRMHSNVRTHISAIIRPIWPKFWGNMRETISSWYTIFGAFTFITCRPPKSFLSMESFWRTKILGTKYSYFRLLFTHSRYRWTWVHTLAHFSKGCPLEIKKVKK